MSAALVASCACLLVRLVRGVRGRRRQSREPIEMTVREVPGLHHLPSVLLEGLARAAAEPHPGGALREHLVRLQDQPPGLGRGPAQTDAPPERSERRDEQQDDASDDRPEEQRHPGADERRLVRDVDRGGRAPKSCAREPPPGREFSTVVASRPWVERRGRQGNPVLGSPVPDRPGRRVRSRSRRSFALVSARTASSPSRGSRPPPTRVRPSSVIENCPLRAS